MYHNNTPWQIMSMSILYMTKFLRTVILIHAVRDCMRDRKHVVSQQECLCGIWYVYLTCNLGIKRNLISHWLNYQGIISLSGLHVSQPLPVNLQEASLIKFKCVFSYTFNFVAILGHWCKTQKKVLFQTGKKSNAQNNRM